MYWCVGRPVLSVRALSTPDVGRYCGDNLILELVFEDGSLGTLTYVASGSNQLGKERIEVFCEGQTIVLDDFKSVTVSRTSGTAAVTEKLRQVDKGHAEECRLVDRGSPARHRDADSASRDLSRDRGDAAGRGQPRERRRGADTERGAGHAVRIRTAAIVGVSALAAIPMVWAAQLNIASLRLVHALASTHQRCAVHESLCVPVGGVPGLTAVAAELEPFVPVSEFSAQGVAFAKAASGDISGAERAWRQTPGALAKLNLGRLYWTTGREALAVDTWRAAGEPTWIGILLQKQRRPAAGLGLDRPSRAVRARRGRRQLRLGGPGRVRRVALPAVPRRDVAFPARPGLPAERPPGADAAGRGLRQPSVPPLTRAEHAAIADQMEAAVRFDPAYSDLHVLEAVSVCLGRGDYATAQREVDTARRLGFALPLPGDLTEGLARKCAVVR